MIDGVDVAHLAVMAQLDDFMLAPTVAEDREFHQILGSCDHFFPKIAVAIGVLTSNGRGKRVATFAEAVMPFGCHDWVLCHV